MNNDAPNSELLTSLTNSSDADLDFHLEVLFGGIKFGSQHFIDLYYECLEKTGTGVANWKWYRRAQRVYSLAKYHQNSLEIDGESIECGVFAGFSALLLCKIVKELNPDFSGKKIHLVDSFEGLSNPTVKDAVEKVELEDGSSSFKVSNPAGHFAVPLEQVRSALVEFPDISYYKGWIPEVLKGLPEKKWAFVHIDVDLYEPTLACLEYFYPRLSRGGVIINDDYRSPAFPGGGSSWDHFCIENNIPFVALDTGQAVITKN